MGRGHVAAAWTAVVGVATACAGDGAAPAAATWDGWPPLGTAVTGPAVVTAALAPAGGGRWEARLVVRSAGPDTVRVEHGSRSFGLRLYRDAALAGPPAWDDRPPPDPPGAPSRAYSLEGYAIAVPPGRAATLAVLGLDPAALPRALAPGAYHVALVYREGARGRGRVHAVRAGAVALPVRR